jgi:hypothetical protein
LNKTADVMQINGIMPKLLRPFPMPQSHPPTGPAVPRKVNQPTNVP